jgi:hypothetical protein
MDALTRPKRCWSLKTVDQPREVIPFADFFSEESSHGS